MRSHRFLKALDAPPDGILLDLSYLSHTRLEEETQQIPTLDTQTSAIPNSSSTSTLEIPPHFITLVLDLSQSNQLAYSLPHLTRFPGLFSLVRQVPVRGS
ncbi:uncharacterized protein BO66DRAFT_396769 [Aspergillus aculeatinus CBS 121060]|uniref:Uncharacterized protein n=1 Tax=Aspergillus aculeatinus CBS 121060 TaxID=1448322 RepID=A0ACD1GQX9_9EURO|nr:hypothetical protein BO66DRAFT_396769 [Aspergillus aculeatinus CBS 121060]RAH63713.1 hypothetical protein BO66DRAFT_396769 [Aspergillus aculeatinus CBS 121060]